MQHDLRVACLLLALGAQRRTKHPRLPPELLELLCYAFGDPIGSFKRLCAAGDVATLQRWHAAFGLGVYQPRLGQGALAACGQGHVPVMTWLYHTFGQNVVEARGAMYSACSGGHLPMVQWLNQTFPPTADLYGPYVACVNNGRQALYAACSNGHLPVAQWLIEQFALTSEDVCEERLLPIVCERGHTAVAKWLYPILKLSLLPVGMCYDVLDRVCTSGEHLDTLQWMCQVDRPSIEICASHALYRACACGQLRVLQWLCQTFPVIIDELPVGPLQYACKHGHVHVVAWLHERFRITESHHALFDIACTHGRLHMAQWLQQTFAITAEDVRRDNPDMMREAHANHHHHVVAWLGTTFQLQLTDG